MIYSICDRQVKDAGVVLEPLRTQDFAPWCSSEHDRVPITLMCSVKKFSEMFGSYNQKAYFCRNNTINVITSWMQQ